MKLAEKQALLEYLEFRLLDLVQQTEKHVKDPDIIGDLYDRAYGLLNDCEQTLTMQAALDAPRPLTANRKH